MENKEQIDEAAELYYLETKHRAPSCKKHFIEGANWQAKRMYTEEEVIRILDKREDYLGTELNIIDYLTNKEWFGQFKTK